MPIAECQMPNEDMSREWCKNALAFYSALGTRHSAFGI
jgi:hypothetical protein